MISDPNHLIYEFLTIQLILRSAGLKTHEMEVSLTAIDKKSTTINLELNQDSVSETLEIGTLKIPLIKVQQFWEDWLADATKDLFNNFSKFKHKLKALRTMESLLEHLEKIGFALSDVPIIQTFK